MKKSAEEIGFNIFALIVVTVFAILCNLPILYTIAGSFTPERELIMGLKLIPEHFTLESYRLVLRDPTAMLRAYGVTIRLVVIGTLCAVIMTTMTAYVLYRRDFLFVLYDTLQRRSCSSLYTVLWVRIAEHLFIPDARRSNVGYEYHYRQILLYGQYSAGTD